MGSSCTDDESWTISRQPFTHSRLDGRVVRRSANLKGNVSKETTQDWQRVTIEALLTAIFDHVEVNCIDEDGRRVVSASNPVIELA